RGCASAPQWRNPVGVEKRLFVVRTQGRPPSAVNPGLEDVAPLGQRIDATANRPSDVNGALIAAVLSIRHSTQFPGSGAPCHNRFPPFTFIWFSRLRSGDPFFATAKLK